MTYGALSLSDCRPTFGLSRAPDRSRGPRHSVCADGVRITLPAGGLISDAEARRLAWAILSDLAPDETIPVPDVVTYKEAQRLAVLRALVEGEKRIDEVASALGWKRRVTERRLHELLGDGRVTRERHGPQDVRFKLAVTL